MDKINVLTRQIVRDLPFDDLHGFSLPTASAVLSARSTAYQVAASEGFEVSVSIDPDRCALFLQKSRKS